MRDLRKLKKRANRWYDQIQDYYRDSDKIMLCLLLCEANKNGDFFIL